MNLILKTIMLIAVFSASCFGDDGKSWHKAGYDFVKYDTGKWSFSSNLSDSGVLNNGAKYSTGNWSFSSNLSSPVLQPSSSVLNNGVGYNTGNWLFSSNLSSPVLQPSSSVLNSRVEYNAGNFSAFGNLSVPIQTGSPIWTGGIGY
jgi:hypothetical protein